MEPVADTRSPQHQHRLLPTLAAFPRKICGKSQLCHFILRHLVSSNFKGNVSFTRMSPLGVANSKILSCIFQGLMYFNLFYISLNMRKSMKYRRSLCALYFSEKLNPPINVSVSHENRSIKIHWKPPPTIGSARKKCFLYQVKITDHKVISFSIVHLVCITTSWKSGIYWT